MSPLIKHITPQKIIFLLSLVILFEASPLNAQDYLYENSAPVEVHKRKSSPVSFPRTTFNQQISKGKEIDFSALSKSFVLSLFYQPDINQELSKIDKEALQYSTLDSCRESEVDMKEVFYHTPGTEALDVLVYDPRSSKHLSQIRKYKGVKVAWDPLYDPSMGSETADARLQDIIRVISPKCLPVRYRFVYIGSKRYRELKYGDKAWEEKP